MHVRNKDIFEGLFGIKKNKGGNDTTFYFGKMYPMFGD